MTTNELARVLERDEPGTGPRRLARFQEEHPYRKLIRERVTYHTHVIRAEARSRIIEGLVIEPVDIFLCPECELRQPGIAHGELRECACGTLFQVYGNALGIGRFGPSARERKEHEARRAYTVAALKDVQAACEEVDAADAIVPVFAWRDKNTGFVHEKRSVVARHAGNLTDVQALTTVPVTAKIVPSLSADVVALVIAAREVFDAYAMGSDEAGEIAALYKSLEPFAERVPFEDEPMDARVLLIVQKQLAGSPRADDAQLDSTLDELGFDSLEVWEFAMAVDEELGIELDDQRVGRWMRGRTITQIAQDVQEALK